VYFCKAGVKHFAKYFDQAFAKQIQSVPLNDLSEQGCRAGFQTSFCLGSTGSWGLQLRSAKGL